MPRRKISSKRHLFELTARTPKYYTFNTRFNSNSVQHEGNKNNLGICAVIGGNGFLGSNIAQQLYNGGYNVRILDTHNEINKNNICEDIEYIQCDITNNNKLYSALTGINTIFHCASVIDIRPSPSSALHNVNINGTKNIINFCNDSNNTQNVVNNIIYTSSIEVLGADGLNGYIDAKENDFIVYGTNKYNQYGKTKAIAEQMVIENKSINKKLKVSAIRLGAIYGPNDIVFIRLLAETKKSGPIYILSESVFSTCYVENAAFAHIQIAKALINENVDGQVFHYKDLDANAVTFRYEVLGIKREDYKKFPYFVALFVAQLMDLKQYILHKWFGKLTGDGYEGFVTSVMCTTFTHSMNMDKFNQIIGYQPPYSVHQSIQKTKNWIDTL